MDFVRYSEISLSGAKDLRIKVELFLNIKILRPTSLRNKMS